MFSVKTTSLKDAGVLNNLLMDYIERKENLGSFYDHFPDTKGFADFFAENNYSFLNRQKLVSILSEQAQSVSNTSAKSRANIEVLKNGNVYTVTTGHQLCLFTGPLYFIYKIFSVINLAEELAVMFPGKQFVPVYWAATEDHDVEEINHFNLFGKTIKWESTQRGAVGDFKTRELERALSSLKEILGTSGNGIYLVQLFEKAYLQHGTLSQATRYLVNELFGEYGLVIADGNDKAFKSQFVEQFKKDIFENSAYREVSKSIAALEQLGYGAQVNPRPINCFYMEEGLRARIEKDNEFYKLIGTEKKFTAQELHSLVENEPQKISPNVVLRPLYQQSILPNAAYVGGPGELAYWLEYKEMFCAFGAVFPVLVPRSFITVIEKNVQSKINKVGLSFSELSKDEQELLKLFQVRSNNVFELNMEKESIEKLYSGISRKITAVDKTLGGSVLAEQQKTLNSIDTLVAKANKALKQRSETEMNQARSIKEKLFPGNMPQERFDNFAGFYTKWGPDFFRALKQQAAPLNLTHVSLIEE